MTQRNATVAGPREWLLADLSRRIEEGRAADETQDTEDGAWWPADLLYEALSPHTESHDATADAAFIASCSPDRMVAVWEYLREKVEQHAFRGPRTRRCYGCKLLVPASMEVCWFVAGLASALGYPGDGGDGVLGLSKIVRDLVEQDRAGTLRFEALAEDLPPTGDSERGTPASSGTSTGPSGDPGPAAVAAKPCCATLQYGYHLGICPNADVTGPSDPAPASPPVQSGGPQR